ncbi:Calvin cycle protein CP12-1, chloroplastic [Linum grandiflorum]
MASMAAGLTLSASPASWKVRMLAAAQLPKAQPFLSMKKQQQSQRMVVMSRAVPDKIEDKVEESIKAAEETCGEDPASGECVAAWDEVEELSAAASHARDKKKGSDPLEAYCQDNPETDECRTYDN